MEKNEIIQGDALEELKKLPDEGVELILTDPPYGIDLEYDEYEDTQKNWFALMNDFIPEAKRVAEMVIMPSCKINNLEWIYRNHPPDWLIAWYKGSPGHSSYIGFNDWEPHLVYGRTKGQLYMHDHFQTEASPEKGSWEHPCPKPVSWSNWLIERATEEGDLVLDPFCGSGTTLVSAKQLSRDFIGIEISEDYIEMAQDRLAQQKLI